MNFADPDFNLADYRRKLSELAVQGAYVGTSSWKYPGWCGLIYDEQRYLTKSRFSEAKFNKECLRDYSETFHTVCVDAGYYQFPSDPWVREMCAQVPETFRFGFKVTDEITIRTFPSLPRFGPKAGKLNPNFLNAEVFEREVLGPLCPFRSKIGPLIFEFSTFHQGEFAHGRDFVSALDRFLGVLPRGWEYGVEIRNKQWLHPDYFATLRSHGVAHVFNSWTRMPSVSEQLAIEGCETADFFIARFLLIPGRLYQEAVASFQPYAEIRSANQDARNAAKEILQRSLQKKRRSYIYVNNRLEGCAPLTIKGLLPGQH